MLTVIQRVTQAKVVVKSTNIGEIETGILALLAVEKEDTFEIADRLLERILNYRIFADSSDKMNFSLRDIKGGLLLVPQFTLAADTENGNRPSFTKAASPKSAREIFDYIKNQASIVYPGSQFGEFGADMQVFLINNGPVTFTLRCNKTHKI